MFCTNCGREISDTSKFCPFCGNMIPQPPAPEKPAVSGEKVVSKPAAPEAPAAQPHRIEDDIELAILGHLEKEPQSAPQPVPSAPPAPDGKKRVKKVPILAIVIPAVVVALAAVAVVIWLLLLNNGYKNALEQGENFLIDEDYRQAEEYFRDALDRKPGSVEAALGLAEARIFRGNLDKAREALEGVSLSAGDALYSDYQLLTTVAGIDPDSCEVITENFPIVTVNFPCPADAADMTVSAAVEEDDERLVTGCLVEDGKLSVTYEAADSGYDSEYRDGTITLSLGKFTIPCDFEYDTPQFTQANVRLVSSDITEYPTVKAYFRVEDLTSGEAVEGLSPKSFIIRERVEGGEYVSREVHSVEVLQGNQGLNIDLVADKSDSISYSDMDKIKKVMTEFVNSLNYAIGDKAEILAFDDIVQQMCAYTNDSTLLVNGIENMSTDGMTAFYDAVYQGIRNASLQGGARCVIAFTDGVDNRSTHNYSAVIDYAIDSQVPVYIIGVGYSVEESILKDMAESTGGRYWFIDDLYDLEEIFNTIYSEQMELYVVEYTSDAAYDGTARRDMEVTVSGGGYKGETSETFEPVMAAPEAATSRYQLIKEACTWEEAAQRCQEMGGHLATITSQDEEDQLIALAESEGVNYVWLGGYTSYDADGNVFGHWVTGEDFNYADWCVDEPSRVDKDGTPEWYIMLWNIESLGGWNWNDQRNDPASVAASMMDEMGYICEFEF